MRTLLRSMSGFRAHYLRLVVVALAVAGLTVQANTFSDHTPTIRQIVLVHPPTVICTHGTVPDLDPRSKTYGSSKCA